MKRRMLRTVGLVLALVAILLPCGGCAEKGPGDGVTRLAFLTDTHYYHETFLDGTDGAYVADLHYDDLFAALTAQLTVEKPQALLISGDLTDGGDEESARLFAGKLATLEAAGIEVLVLPGNHDLDDTETPESRERYMDLDDFAEIFADFGFAEALSVNPVSKSYVYQLSPQLRVMMLSCAGRTDAVQQEYQWVETQLQAAEADGARVLLCSHYGVVQHNPTFDRTDETLLALCERYHVIACLSGDLHIQNVAVSDGGFADICQQSFLYDCVDCRYGIVDMDGSTLSYHTGKVDVLTWGLTHGRLRPWQFTFDREVRKTWEGNFEELTVDAEMRAYLTEACTAYFSGRMDTFCWDEDMTARWKAISPRGWGAQLEGYRSAIGKNSTAWTVSY